MLNPNSGFFPADGEGGYIVEKNNDNIAAGFLWLTNSKQAFFGYMVSNYKYRQEDRQYAMDVLITTVEQIAKKLGYNYIFTITRNMYMHITTTKGIRCISTRLYQSTDIWSWYIRCSTTSTTTISFSKRTASKVRQTKSYIFRNAVCKSLCRCAKLL